MKLKRNSISRLKFVWYSVKEKKYLPIKKIERDYKENNWSYLTGKIVAVLVNDEFVSFKDENSFLQCIKEKWETLNENETAFETAIDYEII